MGKGCGGGLFLQEAEIGSGGARSHPCPTSHLPFIAQTDKGAQETDVTVEEVRETQEGSQRQQNGGSGSGLGTEGG